MIYDYFTGNQEVYDILKKHGVKVFKLPQGFKDDHKEFDDHVYVIPSDTYWEIPRIIFEDGEFKVKR